MPGNPATTTQALLARAVAEREALRKRVAALEKQVADAAKDQAMSQAFHLAGVAKPLLLRPHIAARLRVDAASLQTTKPRVVVLDQYGHETSRSAADLLDEFRTDPDFAGFFASTNPKNGSDNGGNAAPLIPSNPFLRGSKSWNVTQQVWLRRNNPGLAERLEAEAKANPIWR